VYSSGTAQAYQRQRLRYNHITPFSQSEAHRISVNKPFKALYTWLQIQRGL
jgi:hypothetical protein